MCQCTPEIRTPFCGKPGCEWPATPAKWKFCPECGSTETQHEVGDHKQCKNCLQEWFADVDYTDAVRANLRSFNSAKSAAPSEQPATQAEATMDDRLKQIRERAARATPGPWIAHEQQGIVDVCETDRTRPVVHWAGFDNGDRNTSDHVANAAFIAHARDDIPWLLDQLADTKASTPAPAKCRCGRALIANGDDPDPWCEGGVQSAKACDCIALATPAPADELNRLRETVEWVASQRNLFFAECSQAEEIVARCKAALGGQLPPPATNEYVADGCEPFPALATPAPSAAVTEGEKQKVAAAFNATLNKLEVFAKEKDDDTLIMVRADDLRYVISLAKSPPPTPAAGDVITTEEGEK
jgi:hypothetical protein